MNLLSPLAVDPRSLWNADPGSAGLTRAILIALLIGILAMVGMLYLPARARKPIVASAIFAAGLFYVLYYLFPAPINYKSGQTPLGVPDAIGIWITSGVPVVANISNILAAFLSMLGIYSLVRIHSKQLFRGHRDWFFSLVLLVSMVTMLVIGFADFASRQGPSAALLEDPAHWGRVNYARDLLFDGLLQQMDSAMFSLIAFFILSAAYRAFRARSIEASILLGTALIVILSTMTLVSSGWEQAVNGAIHSAPLAHFHLDGFAQNLHLDSIAGWISNNVQVPSIRGIDFGVGIGLLAMGMRIWLSLESTTGGT